MPPLWGFKANAFRLFFSEMTWLWLLIQVFFQSKSRCHSIEMYNDHTNKYKRNKLCKYEQREWTWFFDTLASDFHSIYSFLITLSIRMIGKPWNWGFTDLALADCRQNYDNNVEKTNGEHAPYVCFWIILFYFLWLLLPWVPTYEHKSHI